MEQGHLTPFYDARSEFWRQSPASPSPISLTLPTTTTITPFLSTSIPPTPSAPIAALQVCQVRPVYPVVDPRFHVYSHLPTSYQSILLPPPIPTNQPLRPINITSHILSTFSYLYLIYLYH